MSKVESTPKAEPVAKAEPAPKAEAAAKVETAAKAMLVPKVEPSAKGVEGSEFGEPLFVNGKRVTDNEIKRHLIYGPCRPRMEMYKYIRIIDDELNRRARVEADRAVEPQVSALAMKAAESAVEGQTYATPEEKQKAYDTAYAKAHGEAQKRPEFQKIRDETMASERERLAEALTPREEELQADIKRQFDEFRKRYPVLDLETEVTRRHRSMDWFKEDTRLTMFFDHVFYPEDPADWPETTIEAVRADSGPTLLDDAVNSYKMRREHSDKTGEPLGKEDTIYTTMMRQIVRDALYNTIDYKTAFDGLPDDLVLTADKDFDGKPEMTLTTEQVWNDVKNTVTKNEIEMAKQWFVASMATTDRLKAEGALLDEAGRRQAIADLQKQFVGTYITVDILAMQNYYFPSTESFKEFYALSKGFEKAMEPKLAAGPNGEVAEPLKAHLDRANRVMGLGQIDVDCILVSAFDIPKNRWKPDGFNGAKARADAIKVKLDEHAVAYAAQREGAAKAQSEGKEFKPENPVKDPFEFWTNTLMDNSEYWDPPTPENAGGKGSDIGMKKRGRFGLRYRNDLEGYVGETPFYHWVTGESVTDRAFFDCPEGSIQGPFKGPQGYYIVRVTRRLPPTFPLNVAEPKKADLLKQDYLRVAFIAFTKEAVAKADIRGFTRVDS
ncbi:MAG: hypothetical protein SGI72_01385 [Planctomycetota bacterium]|nr:hypothetical protein [Planctomycetota bacterium]